MGLIVDIYKNGAFVRREDFINGDVFKIGRLPSSHVRLDDDAVSRMHAVIEAVEEGTQLIDLGSATGTTVKGKKIIKSWLAHGDFFSIGPFDIVVYNREASSTPATPAATFDGAERYPEHEKLKALGGKNDVVGRFIEWLRESGYEICALSKDGRDFEPLHRSTEQLLADHFDIDVKKLNAEKDAMLASLRKATQKAGQT